MFREMRRKKQQLSDAAVLEILSNGTSGVLAVSGDEGYPYAVPMSYVYMDGKLYFHCAVSGHKLDAVTKNPKVSFCVVAEDSVQPEEYTTLYRSVIAFGKIRVLKDTDDFTAAITALAKKYYPEDTEEHRNEYIDRDIDRMCMMEMEIDHMTGKASMKLVK